MNKSKSHMNELMLATGLAFLILASVAVVSHDDPVRFSPGWLTAGASMAGLILLLFVASWLWRLCQTVEHLLLVLVGCERGPRDDLAAVLGILREILRELRDE